MMKKPLTLEELLEVAVKAISGNSRPGQIEMAKAVHHAMEQREHLLVQAGTGTGKSLAYLIPAIFRNKTVLIATATLALQRQLVERDQTIQQLQHRLLQQNDVLNALTTQVNSQRIGRIEELLLSQNEQLGELQKRLSEPSEIPVAVPTAEPSRKGFWQRVFGK